MLTLLGGVSVADVGGGAVPGRLVGNFDGRLHAGAGPGCSGDSYSTLLLVPRSTR